MYLLTSTPGHKTTTLLNRNHLYGTVAYNFLLSHFSCEDLTHGEGMGVVTELDCNWKGVVESELECRLCGHPMLDSLSSFRDPTSQAA